MPENPGSHRTGLSRLRAAIPATALGAALPLIAAAPTAPDLAAYAGRYPSDAVQGVAFVSHPKVRALVREASLEPLVVQEMLSRGVSGPIVRTGPMLIMSGCRPHTCGSVNWALLIRLPSGPAAACYYNDLLTERQSRWLVNGQLLLSGKLACNSSNVPKQVSDALR